MLSGDVPPNQTIYIRNLEEKIKKEGTEYGFLTCLLKRGRPLVKSFPKP
jgi:hypothetical protein